MVKKIMEKEQKIKDWEKKYPEGKSNLAWKLDDYLFWGEEAPERLSKNPKATEGELMSQEEIESWIIDNFRSFYVIKEEKITLFEKLHKDFIQDIKYLISIGKVREEILDELDCSKNFSF